MSYCRRVEVGPAPNAVGGQILRMGEQLRPDYTRIQRRDTSNTGFFAINCGLLKIAFKDAD